MHKAEVRLDQLVVRHMAEPIEVERVGSAVPNPSPSIVTLPPPVATPFRMKELVTTGESKEKPLSEVPTEETIVKTAVSDDPLPGASEQLTEDVEVQAVVMHTVCDKAAVAVVSADHKLMPEIVSRVRPLPTPFLGSTEAIAGPSNENGFASVPTIPERVRLASLLRVRAGEVSVTRVPLT